MKKKYEKQENFELRIRGQIEVLSSILEGLITKHGSPENVYIVQDKIGGHDFGSPLGRVSIRDTLLWENEYLPKVREYNGSGQAEEAKKLETDYCEKMFTLNSDQIIEQLSNKYTNYNNVFKETINLGFDKEELTKIVISILKQEIDHKSFSTLWSKFISSKIEESIVKNIAKEKIKIVQDFDHVESGDKNYVVINRHAYSLGQEKNKITLPLPFESTVDYIMKNNLLDVDTNDLENVIEEKIASIFQK